MLFAIMSNDCSDVYFIENYVLGEIFGARDHSLNNGIFYFLSKNISLLKLERKTVRYPSRKGIQIIVTEITGCRLRARNTIEKMIVL